MGDRERVEQHPRGVQEVIVKKIGKRNPPSRAIQKLVIEMYRKSNIYRQELGDRLPTINRSILYKYLDGDKDVFFRERQLEWIMAAMRAKR